MHSRLTTGIVVSLLIGFSAMAVVPVTWNIRSSPSSNHLHGVTYGNGVFVAVGSQATILTSRNGRDWTVRPLGTTAPTIWAAAYGNGRYVLGGGEGTLIRSSTNAIDWTNGLSTIGAENINAVAFANGTFVAVGRGEQVNTSYILTSTNGLDWVSRTPPTTNTLYGVSPVYGARGIGWAEDLIVAVGEHGTILTSTNGVDWILRASPTTETLRTVLFHQSNMLALGDHGVVLESSDAVTWHFAAPTSFDVRGAASSWDAIVAVGNYFEEGRLHVSVDGLTWPGLSTPFPFRLNAAAYGAGSFVVVGDHGLIVQSRAINEWTKAESGYWTELDFWSLNELPALNQDLIAFTNPGFKALAVNSSASKYYSNSLAITSLTVDAPPGSYNQLLLNYAGLDVPLSVAADFVLGTNGSLVSYYSALEGGAFYLSGVAAFSEDSAISFNKIELESNVAAELNLTNSFLAADQLVLGPSAKVDQSGGSNEVSSLRFYGDSSYTLDLGTLIASNFELQALGESGASQFKLISGFMNVQNSLQVGYATFSGPNGRGEFRMDGGWLLSPVLHLINGSFTQNGGTNLTPAINLPAASFGLADYFLADGTLLSSNVMLGYYGSPFTSGGFGTFSQTGGVHTNSSMSLYGYLRTASVHPTGRYSLEQGWLISDAITVTGGVFAQSGGTNHAQELLLDNAGAFTLTGGELVTSNTTMVTHGCVESRFIQNGGIHAVGNRFLLQDWARYELTAGTLIAANIEIGPGGLLKLQGGTISNAGLFTIRGGAVDAVGQVPALGQLQVIGVADATCASAVPGPRTLSLDILGGSGRMPVVLRFLDSREVAWTGLPLSISGWRPPGAGFGGDHIFVGTSAGGLTAAQLQMLNFVDPVGASSPARILSNGELVPALYVPPIGVSRVPGKLILTWDGEFELVSATNAAGPYLPVPGAFSPLTNNFTEPQRYFWLRLTLP